MSAKGEFIRAWGAVLGLGGLLAGSSMALAADLPSIKEPVPAAPVVDDFQPFFIKLGVTYAINSGSSRLWGQDPALYPYGITAQLPAGVGATLGNVTTIGVEAGYYVTHAISLDVSGGIPFYARLTTKGYNPLNPGLPNGTELTQLMPALIPITAVYHFDMFGNFRPYLGVGFAPGFSFSQKDAYLTDNKVEGTIGAVFQAGADYMIDRHWGVGVDVKKVVSYVEGGAYGLAAAPGIPATTTIHTNFDPWLISAGVIYRFGGADLAPVTAKY